MTNESALAIVQRRHDKEMARLGNYRPRGNDQSYLRAIAFLLSMPYEDRWCARCGSKQTVQLHHKISRRHNLLHQVEFLCLSCHVVAHNGHFALKPNQENIMSRKIDGRNIWGPAELQDLATAVTGDPNFTGMPKKYERGRFRAIADKINSLHGHRRSPYACEKQYESKVKDRIKPANAWVVKAAAPKVTSRLAAVVANKRRIPASVVIAAMASGYEIDFTA